VDLAKNASISIHIFEELAGLEGESCIPVPLAG
jgi:hypothetical protein